MKYINILLELTNNFADERVVATYEINNRLRTMVIKAREILIKDPDFYDIRFQLSPVKIFRLNSDNDDTWDLLDKLMDDDVWLTDEIPENDNRLVAMREDDFRFDFGYASVWYGREPTLNIEAYMKNVKGTWECPSWVPIDIVTKEE